VRVVNWHHPKAVTRQTKEAAYAVFFVGGVLCGLAVRGLVHSRSGRGVARANSNETLKLVQQIYEGARPTLDRLALLIGANAATLQKKAEAEKWRAIAEPELLARRVTVLSDRMLGLLEEPDDAELLSKGRIDQIIALMKAVEKLREIARDSTEGPDDTSAEEDVGTAFAAIDQRISELAHAHAERLVKAGADGQAGAAGAGGMVSEGPG
jgi:hypothetical protein